MSLLIGIAGAPGSGKSTVAEALAKALGDAQVISMDSYERIRSGQSTKSSSGWDGAAT